MDATGFQESTDPPRLCVGTSRAAWFGRALDLAPHLNVATTLAVSSGDGFELRRWNRTTGWSDWRRQSVALIASGTLHHLRGRSPMAFLYLDPLGDDVAAMTPETLSTGRARLLAIGGRPSLSDACAAFGIPLRRTVDARIVRVAREVERRPHDFARLQDAAALACLSPSRFRARFVREVGLPFRRYRLWRRMAVVMRVLAGGGDLTQAAHASGFASSAHLSTAFRQMFGLAPGELRALHTIIDLSEDAPAG